MYDDEKVNIEIVPQEPNTVRKDLPWTHSTVVELKQIQESCYTQSKKHQVAMKNAKCKYTVFGLPSMLVPLVIGGVGSYISDEFEWIRSAGLIFTALNSGILQFFNFGEKKTLHNESSGRYDELGDYIKMELSKPSEHRVSCDVFMERVFVKFQNINTNAPPV